MSIVSFAKSMISNTSVQLQEFIDLFLLMLINFNFNLIYFYLFLILKKNLDNVAQDI